MKNFVILILSLLSFHANASDCAKSAHTYRGESDDVGVTVSLTYSCNSPKLNDTVCVYSNNDYAVIAGAGLSTSELERQKISSSEKQLYISLKTGILKSILDYRHVEFNLNKSTSQAILTSTKRGIDPFKGIVVSPKQQFLLNCFEEN